MNTPAPRERDRSTRQLRRTQLGLLVAMAIVSSSLPVNSADDHWQHARPDYRWDFPRDHWAHHEFRTEWWYFTGQLTGSKERRLGYQFTFFRIGLLGEVPSLKSDWAARDLIMGHAALTDLEGREHRFSEMVYRASPLLGGFGVYPDTLLAWSRGPAGTGETWRLKWNGNGFDFSMADHHNCFSFSLQTSAVKPKVFQGPNGFSLKETQSAEKPAAASQYYSFPRLRTRGEVIIDQDTLLVTGESWMDKEFGSGMLGEDQVGWDWFSLQRDDGSEVMLYLLRRKDGSISHGSGTCIAADGTARHIDVSDFRITVTATWTSPASGATYPSEWRLQLEGQDLLVRPLLSEQENFSKRIEGMFYWEGAVSVLDASNRKVGRGYVELTGYGEGRMPGL